MAGFTYDGHEVPYLADPFDWLMAEASAVKKFLGVNGVADIAEALKNLDPDAMTAVAAISIKRVVGVMPAITDVANAVPLKGLMDAIANMGKETETPDPTQAAEAAPTT